MFYNEFILIILFGYLSLLGYAFIFNFNLININFTKVAVVWTSLISFFSFFTLIFFDKFGRYLQYTSLYDTYFIRSLNSTFSFSFNQLSVYFVLLVIVLTPICFLFNLTNSKYSSLRYNVSIVCISLFSICAFLTDDIIVFFVFFESILIPMFIIISEFGGSTNKISAAYYFLIYTIFGSILLLFSVLNLSIMFGTSNLNVMLTKVSILQNNLFFTKILFWCMFLGFAVKVPMFPFHIWLPAAHVEAPTVGSIILAGILLKLGGYGMLKFLIPIFAILLPDVALLPILLALLSIIFCTIVIFRQADAKSIIAYSSIIHMNIAVMGIFSNTLSGYNGAVIMMIAHGVVSPLLFVLVGILYNNYHTRIIYYFSGLFMFSPLFCIALIIGSLANFGFPLTINFFAEFLLIIGLFEKNFFLAVVLILPLFTSVAYSLWLYNRISHGSISKFLNVIIDLTLLESIIIIILIAILVFLYIFSFSFFSFLNYYFFKNFIFL